MAKGQVTEVDGVVIMISQHVEIDQINNDREGE